MNVLQQLRAATAQQGALDAPPVPASAQQPAAPTAAPEASCPFTFGDWLPRTDPQAQPGEAQRAIFLNGTLCGWWRRQVLQPLPLDGDPPERLGHLFHAHAIASPDGAVLLAASLHAQPMLEGFAAAI
jgi:hypothetical protein